MAVWIGLLSFVALLLTFLKDASKPNASGRRKWDITISLAFALLLVNTGVEVAKRVADSKSSSKIEEQQQQIRNDIKAHSDSTIAALDRLRQSLGSLPKERAEKVAQEIDRIRTQSNAINKAAVAENLNVSGLAKIRDSIEGVQKSINRLQDQVIHNETSRRSDASFQSNANFPPDSSGVSKQNSDSPESSSASATSMAPTLGEPLSSPPSGTPLGGASANRAGENYPERAENNADRVSEPTEGTCDERISWARERMYPSQTRTKLKFVYQWLTNGTRSCTNTCDLWYYRALTAKELGDSADRTYSLTKAKACGSQALASGFNPFSSERPPQVSSAIRTKWAVIVGVSGPESSSPDSLEFHPKDAVMLRDVLVNKSNFTKDQIRVLIGKDATTSNIRMALADIQKRSEPDDLVFVYISSHGVPRNLMPEGLSYILTADTDSSNSATLFATALQTVEFAEFGRTVHAHAFILVLDACFGGTLRPTMIDGVMPDGLDSFEPLRGMQIVTNRAVIVACKATEKSYVEPTDDEGYFVHYLVDELGKSGPTQPLSSIFEYVSSHVTAAVSRQYNRQQHPQMQEYGAQQNIDLGIKPSSP